MGLSTVPAPERKLLNGFGAMEISQEVDSLFDEQRAQDALTKLTSKTFGIADKKLRAVIGFSYLFPHESKRCALHEGKLERLGYYLEFTKRRLKEAAPNDWGVFIKDFGIPLVYKVNRSTSNLLHSLQTRKPSQQYEERSAEYEVLRECAGDGVLDDVRRSTKKYIHNEEQEAYLLASVTAALTRIYQSDARRLVSESMLQRVSPEALFMYAFVLSKLERKDVFSTYARKNVVQNKIPVKWDFSWS